MADEIDSIRSRFGQNIDRVDNLVDVYKSIRADTSGRVSVAQQDVLRAAVVFLHASLEGLLRGALRWRLPSAEPKVFRKLGVPLPGEDQNREFNLGHLVAYRGTRVDELLEESVDEYLENSTFNHPGEIKNNLDHLGLDRSLMEPYAAEIGPMMKRRHHIVHRMDDNRSQGRGHHSARSIDVQTVETWRGQVEAFGDDFLSALERQT